MKLCTNCCAFANHYYERNNSCFCLFRNLFSLSFLNCSQIYYFCKLIINRLSTIQSHPSWVRGLKLKLSDISVRHLSSHPSWVRGLKLSLRLILLKKNLSHPSWVRGLKQQLAYLSNNQQIVAPLVGAWIETYCTGAYRVPTLGRTPRGCVD